MNVPYTKYKDYLIKRYGEPLYRVPIDFDLSCPHRNPDGSGGCTFCNLRGSRAVQTIGQDSVEQQMLEAIRFARERYRAKKFMAYIQAFSATFGPQQRPQYEALLDAYPFDAVSIGTRPDCLRPQAYEFLEKLHQRIDTWVELGVQTTHEHTLQRINRGHTWGCSETAIQKLHRAGIKVVVHVILGLPGETPEDYQQTAQTLAALPISAVKIHNLHIEKETTLAREHAETPIPTLMEHEFAEYCMDFIRRMPPSIPIMRLTTDTLDEELIAPRWNMAKGQFTDYLSQQMICREWQQGDLFSPRKSDSKMASESALKTVTTKDGSITFWNTDYKEHYHTPAGARLEAEQKYLHPAHLKRRLAEGPVRILDICFGLGYNSLAAMNWAAAQNQSLEITALEMDRRVVGAAAREMDSSPEDRFSWKSALHQLHHSGTFSLDALQCKMLWGDARYTITLLNEAPFDLIFLDAFSTQRNSELWTLDFFNQLRKKISPTGQLLTYCAALPVRSALLKAGFFVGETDPVGRTRGGTVASLRGEGITHPLPDQELKTIQETTRGLPYRDPHSVWTNKEILRDRQERILKQKAATA